MRAEERHQLRRHDADKDGLALLQPQAHELDVPLYLPDADARARARVEGVVHHQLVVREQVPEARPVCCVLCCVFVLLEDVCVGAVGG